MSSSIDIYPFSDIHGVVRFGLQIVIFFVGLFIAHRFVIKPALALYEERRRRTVGHSDSARKDVERANLLEHEYFSRLKVGADTARLLRSEEIAEAQRLAMSIVSQAQTHSNDYIKSIQERLGKESLEAKIKLAPLIDEVVNAVYKNLGILSSLVVILLGAVHLNTYAAEATPTDSAVFWYGIFWPYFQFALFLAAAFFLGKKPIQNFLQKRREDLSTKLSEAREAVYLADKKVKEYEDRLSSLEKEIQELKERNLVEGRLERERILADANKLSASILKDAERTSQDLIQNAKISIQKELFSMAIQEVEKRLTPERLQALDKNLKQELVETIKQLH